MYKKTDGQAAEGVRLNKAMAQAGLCSRRQADEWIEQGLVRVNGLVVRELGLRLLPGDKLVVQGKNINPFGKKEPFTYLLLNKPVQIVSTARDPEGRTTVMDLLPPQYAGRRLYPVGRLDFFSEGLLLLTDDGDLTQRLTHPRHQLPKDYEVLVRENVSAEALHTMCSGMTLAEGEKLAPVEAVRKGRNKRGEVLRLTLRQGINRQIRRMCRDLGLTILSLRRVAQGPLELGDLEAGTCRELTPAEVHTLRQLCGL